MNEIAIQAASGTSLDDETIEQALITSLKNQNRTLKKILLLPPDLTRMHSLAGKITAIYYKILKDTCEIDIMPALGTHEPMTKKECTEFFGETVPFERIIAHDWRNDIVKIGEIPAKFVTEISEGLVNNTITVEVNKRLLDPSYDLIISIGQVVPHEVVGMANYSKNVFVGCGGSAMINESHMLGAFYGMERIMGRDFSPVRKVFDYAEEHFIQSMPLMYVLTVTSCEHGTPNLHGLFIGRKRRLFESAVTLSQEKNLIFLDKAPKKIVVFLDEREFKSTWLGNKAIYRTRMAIADGGELIILAPGVKKFGEDPKNDELIRKYGYLGRKKILALCKEKNDLKENLSVAAHLIHGSSDGRFSITYAVENLTREEIESAHFTYMKLADTREKYNPEVLKDGFNTLGDGEEIYFIRNPALGLWAYRALF